MTRWRNSSQNSLMEILLILVLAAITYLPNLSQATIYRDDWYYVMDRLIGGPGVFQEMFNIDRPIRGPLFEAYYQLFGIQPFPYHMSSLLWRALGGLAALWLFRQLWPHQRLAGFLMALLFILYPGYLRWMEGFENQPRILSSFLQTLSIAMTLQAVKTTRTLPKILLWTGSVLTGWAYIALVDFAFGMEIFRLLCVFLLINREKETLSFIQKGISAVKAWSIAALIPFGFLFWRLFLFQNERQQTDIGVQLGYLFASPLLTGLWWMARTVQSAVNVVILAWSAPLFQDLFGMGLSDILTGLLIAGVAVVLLLWGNVRLWKMGNHDTNTSADISSEKWQFEAIWVGLAGVLAGILPVIVANRYVFFGGYSHYSLPASLASVMVVVGLVFLAKSHPVRLGLLTMVVFLAVLTHYTVSLRVLREEQIIANFWQQVVWRAPGIKAGTTLVVRYPSISYAEDIDAVAGPANFIYYPEQTNQIPAVYQLTALAQMDYTTKDVLGGGDKFYGYRTHVGEVNFDHILVISQHAENACVHFIDSRWPRYSDLDADQILLLGQYSKIQNVLVDGRAPRPAEFVFGPEPAHAWCYYYQQAELALQAGNWEEIVEIGDHVNQAGLAPNDRIEWAPFLQAYALLGDEKAFKTVATKIDSSPFVRKEACRTLLHMQEIGSAFTPGIQSLMKEKLCRGDSVLNP